MHRFLLILALAMVYSTSWASVDKLPASHDAHVAQVEAAKTAPREDPPWADRVGTIKHALAQVTGTQVNLDCVTVGAIYKIPQAYFVIYDWGQEANRSLIVNVPAPVDLRPGMQVDVVGTLSTLSDGRKFIEYPTVLAYLDKTGTLLLHGPCIKGITEPTPWAWKKQLVSVSKPTEAELRVSSGVKSVASTSIDSSPYPIKGLKTYESVKALADAAPTEGSWIRLRQLTIYKTDTDTNGPYLIVKDSKTSTMFQVYTTSKPKIATARIGRLIAKVHIVNGTRILIVDVGPSYDPQLGTGDIWILD